MNLLFVSRISEIFISIFCHRKLLFPQRIHQKHGRHVGKMKSIQGNKCHHTCALLWKLDSNSVMTRVTLERAEKRRFEQCAIIFSSQTEIASCYEYIFHPKWLHCLMCPHTFHPRSCSLANTIGDLFQRGILFMANTFHIDKLAIKNKLHSFSS